jgi:hypothetical protein
MKLIPDGAEAGDVILRLEMRVVELPDGSTGTEPLLESADAMSVGAIIAMFMAIADMLSNGEIGELVRYGLAAKVAEGSDIDEELRKLVDDDDR